MALECIDLCATYPKSEARALDGVSFCVAPGERVAVAGCSGCGKSTLLRCLAGSMMPSSGEVFVDGRALAGDAATVRFFCERAGLVQQMPEQQLFARTMWEDVAFGPRNAGLAEGEGAGEVDGRVRWALSAVGLFDERLLERSPFTLSGGEKRRAAIAGMLALRPSYLLLDEPTAGLDPRERERLLRILRDLADEGTAVVVVSHDIEALAGWCERAVLLKGGKVAAEGSAGEVFGDAELLRAAGLVPPPAVLLAEQLRARGIDIPAGSVSAQDLARALGARGGAR